MADTYKHEAGTGRPVISRPLHAIHSAVVCARSYCRKMFVRNSGGSCRTCGAPDQRDY